MDIAMESKIRVRTFRYFDKWPENHQKQLISPILVPIPVCDRKVITGNYSPGACKAPKLNGTTPHHSNVTHKGKSCNQTLKDGTYNAHSCGFNEVCEQSGYCTCLVNYIRINGTCTPGFHPIVPVVFEDKGIVDSGSSMTSTIVIVVVVAVVAFLIMLAVGFFVVKYRRYRARYGNHQLLNEDDNNAPDDPLDEDVEDDPPLDIST